jgi:hypothetical protein
VQYYANLLLLPLAALSARRMGCKARWALAGLVAGAAACTAVAYVTSYYYVRLYFAERFATIVAPVILLCLAIIAAHPPRRTGWRLLCWALVALNAGGMAWHGTRLFREPYHIQNRAILELVRADPGEPQPEIFVAFVNEFDGEVFRFYKDRLAPDLPIQALTPKSRIPLPAPENPVWIVVTQAAFRSRNRAVQLAEAILNPSDLARGYVVTPTFQAFLITRSRFLEQSSAQPSPSAQP